MHNAKVKDRVYVRKRGEEKKFFFFKGKEISVPHIHTVLYNVNVLSCAFTIWGQLKNIYFFINNFFFNC